MSRIKIDIHGWMDAGRIARVLDVREESLLFKVSNAPKHAPPKRPPAKFNPLAGLRPPPNVDQKDPPKGPGPTRPANKPAAKKDPPKTKEPEKDVPKRPAKTYHRNNKNHFETDNHIKPPSDNTLRPTRSGNPRVTASDALKNRSNAKDIEAKAPKPESTQWKKLDQDQKKYQDELKKAKTTSDRERVMKDYFADGKHEYVIDTSANGKPVVYAAEFQDKPKDSKKPAGVVLSRTGEDTTNQDGKPVKSDTTIRQNADLTTTRSIKLTAKNGETHADQVLNEETDAQGRVTERETSTTLAVGTKSGATETKSEKFDAKGEVKERYRGIATFDEAKVTVEERTDALTAGKVTSSSITNSTATRNFDQETFDDYNSRIRGELDKLDSGDKYDINKSEDVTVPATGSEKTSSTQNYTYNDKGEATSLTVTNLDSVVRPTNRTREDGSVEFDGNGVEANTITQEMRYGSGYAPIFEAGGVLKNGGTLKQSVSSTIFDANGGLKDGYARREATDQTSFGQISKDGKAANLRYSPLKTATLLEGSDDDYAYDRLQLKVDEKTGQVKTDDKGKPIEYKKGDSIVNAATGSETRLIADPAKHRKDMDFWDEHDPLSMISAGMSIVGTVLIFTPLAPVGGALLAGGAALALTRDLPELIKNPGNAGNWVSVGLDVAGVATSGATATARAGVALNSARAAGTTAELGAATTMAGRASLAGAAAFNTPLLTIGGRGLTASHAMMAAGAPILGTQIYTAGANLANGSFTLEDGLNIAQVSTNVFGGAIAKHASESAHHEAVKTGAPSGVSSGTFSDRAGAVPKVAEGTRTIAHRATINPPVATATMPLPRIFDSKPLDPRLDAQRQDESWLKEGEKDYEVPLIAIPQFFSTVEATPLVTEADRIKAATEK